MRGLLASVFKGVIAKGHLALVDYDDWRRDFGEMSQPPVILRLHDRRAAFDIVRNPYLKLGEAYMDGRISVEGGSIADLLYLLTKNLGIGFGGGYLEGIGRARRLLRGWAQWNGLPRSQRNVAHHYDLSAALYGLFLDADKQYSCAFFETPTDTLEAAQLNKKRRIAAKLVLKRGQRVLDIGSGWGGLALHLAETAEADVTGITLSTEQLKVANERAAEARLADRARFRLEDYRQTEGRFDRIVSVGMFEHVGVGQYPAFFKRIAALLADDGVALIHSIGRSDGPGATNPWLAKYIFPGGYTPALSEVLPAVESAGLIVTDIEILRLHYARTLAEWRRRFILNWDKAKSLYDERFCRMWEFYLAGAEMAFRYQGQMVFQLQLTKRVDTLPIVRDYMIPAASIKSHAVPRRAA